MTTVRIKRSGTPGAVPTAGQIASGELALNTADRKLFAKDSTGTVFVLAAPPAAADPSLYLWQHAVDGNMLYIGRLEWADYPASSGSPEDSSAWVIYRITTNSAGDVLSEQSATGEWSNKTQLSYS